MASNPIGQCCVVGVKHEGTAVGEVKTLGNGLLSPIDQISHSLIYLSSHLCLLS